MRVVRGFVNTGVYGDHFDILISNLKGGIVSYRYGGREMIEWIPRPNFWRAPTDNDFGNKMPARYGQWKLASLYQDFVYPDLTRPDPDAARYPIIRQTENFVEVTFKKYLPTEPMCFCLVGYRITADGTVRVSMRPGEDDPAGRRLLDLQIGVEAEGRTFTAEADKLQLIAYN